MKRLGIFIFYDKYGYVGEYVRYLLNAVKQCCDDLYIISNCPLSESEQKKLRQYSQNFYIRCNIGLDAGAIKYFWAEVAPGIDISVYDEIFWLNDTCYGPVYPLTEAFQTMEKKEDLDFWGMTAHPRNAKHFRNLPYLPEHIQSYFVAVRKSLFTSDVFRKFWEDLPLTDSHEETVLNYEIGMTSVWSANGFRYGVYCDTHDYDEKENGSNPSFTLIYDLIARYRFPFIKKRHLAASPDLYLLNGNGDETASAFQYIRSFTDYPTEYIITDLARLYPVEIIERNLAMDYILSADSQKDISPEEAACAVCVSTESDLKIILEYIEKTALSGFFIILTDSPEIKEKVPDPIRSVLCSGKTIAEKIQDPNAVRELSRFSYICLLGDAFQNNCSDAAKNHFRQRMLVNLVCSRSYIAEVAECFRQNPYIGFLTPYMSYGDVLLSKEDSSISEMLECGVWVKYNAFSELVHEDVSLSAVAFRQRTGHLRGNITEKHKAQMLLARYRYLNKNGHDGLQLVVKCKHISDASLPVESVCFNQKQLFRMILGAFFFSVRNRLRNFRHHKNGEKQIYNKLSFGLLMSTIKKFQAPISALRKHNKGKT